MSITAILAAALVISVMGLVFGALLGMTGRVFVLLLFLLLRLVSRWRSACLPASVSVWLWAICRSGWMVSSVRC